jgi:hypothetical protein
MCARPSGERRGGALARRGKPQRNGEKTTLCDSLPGRCGSRPVVSHTPDPRPFRSSDARLARRPQAPEEQQRAGGGAHTAIREPTCSLMLRDTRPGRDPSGLAGTRRHTRGLTSVGIHATADNRGRPVWPLDRCLREADGDRRDRARRADGLLEAQHAGGHAPAIGGRLAARRLRGVHLPGLPPGTRSVPA